jgi:hypothetical protein
MSHLTEENPMENEEDVRKEESEEESLADLTTRLAMILFRRAGRLSQGDFARITRVAASLVSVYDRGKRPLPKKTLEKIAARLDFPSHLVDPLLREIRSFLLAWRGRARSDRTLEDGFVMELLAVAHEAGDLILSPRRHALPNANPRPRAEDRRGAEQLLASLRRCTAAERRLLVAEAQEYRSWAVCEGAALESVALAPNHPREALEWAELAFRIAELVPGKETWRWRLLGWTLHFVANARRACDDVAAAERDLVSSRELWEAGAPGASGLLDETWLPWIEAVFLRAKRRFGEALQKIDEALALDKGDLRAQILVSRSRIFEALGDPEASTAALLEAEPLIDVHKEPRLAFGVRFNLLVDLCALGRAAEAAPRLLVVVELAEQLGEALDLTRCSWLEGKVEAGLGHTAEALATFGRVRRDFEERDLVYDYALVSLDLALVLLELGRAAEVRKVAEEMLAIFKAQEVHREALAALRVFCEAAKREVATVELVRQVERFLRRAQLDPGLKFEEEGAEAL